MKKLILLLLITSPLYASQQLTSFISIKREPVEEKDRFFKFSLDQEFDNLYNTKLDIYNPTTYGTLTVSGAMTVSGAITSTGNNTFSGTNTFTSVVLTTVTFAQNADLLDGHDSTYFPGLSLNNTFTGGNYFTARSTFTQILTVDKYLKQNGKTSIKGYYESNSPQTINNATLTPILFDAKRRDDLGEYDVGTASVTFQHAGTYMIVLQLHFIGLVDDSIIMAYIDLNGVSALQESQFRCGSGGNECVKVITVEDLNAGDVITFYGYQATGGSSSVGNNSYNNRASGTYFIVEQLN